MSDLDAIQRIGVLLAFAVVLMLLNLKAASKPLKFLTYWAMNICLVAAGFVLGYWLVS